MKKSALILAVISVCSLIGTVLPDTGIAEYCNMGHSLNASAAASEELYQDILDMFYTLLYCKVE